MRYTAVEPATGLPIPNAAAHASMYPDQKLTFKYFPRIRCLDCPGKLYTPGPATSVDNFEVHLKNQVHKERVEERCARAEKGRVGSAAGVEARAGPWIGAAGGMRTMRPSET